MHAQPMYPAADRLSAMPTWMGMFAVIAIVFVVLFVSGSQRGRKLLLIGLGVMVLLFVLYGWTAVRMVGPPQMAQQSTPVPAAKRPEDSRKKESKSKSNSSKGKSSKKGPEKGSPKTSTKAREGEFDGAIPVEVPKPAVPDVTQPVGNANSVVTKPPMPPEPSDEIPAEATTPTPAPNAATPNVQPPVDKPPPIVVKTQPNAPSVAAPMRSVADDSHGHGDLTADARAAEAHEQDGDERPAWVDDGDKVDRDGTTTIVIKTSPKASINEARNYEVQNLDTAFNRYVELRIPQLRGRTRGMVDGLGIAQMAKAEEYLEWTQSRFAGANMVTVHQKFVFTPQMNDQVIQSARNHLLSMRAGLIVLVGICTLLVVGIAYGYLRIDTATKGYYTWRLRLASVVALCLVFGLFMTLMEEERLYLALRPLPDTTMISMRN